MYCENCGALLLDKADICIKCGALAPILNTKSIMTEEDNDEFTSNVCLESKYARNLSIANIFVFTLSIVFFCLTVFFHYNSYASNFIRFSTIVYITAFVFSFILSLNAVILCKKSKKINKNKFIHCFSIMQLVFDILYLSIYILVFLLFF